MKGATSISSMAIDRHIRGQPILGQQYGCMHLAAQPIVSLSYEQPLETLQTNVLGTANLLRAASELQALKAALVVTSDKCYQNNEWET